MKKHIAKKLRKLAKNDENIFDFDKGSVNKKYKELKRAWKSNIKNGKEVK